MRTTARAIQALKQERPVVLISAYDALWARLAESAGADILLVGDSVGIDVLGYGSVLPVSAEMLLHHLRAVVRGSSRALVVADMPLGEYGIGDRETMHRAMQYVKEGGAGAIKMAGGSELAESVRKLTKLGIPVMGHIGVNSSHWSLGEVGPVVGRTTAEQQQLLSDAKALEAAGVFALIAKCVTVSVTQELCRMLRIPVISIGSGDADGVGANCLDIVGLARESPWFSLRQVNGGEWLVNAMTGFVDGVRSGTLSAKSWKEKSV
ncbi:MAG: 3-methyl-2-oxobutanoate hydroxymethyltransferase [Sulfobacillus acidophilus]|uniref:3-methyl-2-oxobutanoate hydroxymethyltransferase n=1 Tax=Sulfobacillus acidophilus TaxID=53633 RepID=A0A2T2WCP3_9FIRM|nr:MAG: 3-methyl-2-oxobutanoate hydroxymethyltransferase [Sulfobacillus acidophilus]